MLGGNLGELGRTVGVNRDTLGHTGSDNGGYWDKLGTLGTVWGRLGDTGAYWDDTGGIWKRPGMN